ncbi:MAG TPA: hypothetical protein VGK43_06305, partial [Solirubrobacterales bacterium]
SVGTYEDPGPDQYIVCDCGETVTVIDLRDELVQECRGALAKLFTPDDCQLLHDAAAMAITLYDAVEEESGVPKTAPLYGKRDRLEHLARRLDHQANCQPRDHVAREGCLPEVSTEPPSLRMAGTAIHQASCACGWRGRKRLDFDAACDEADAHAAASTPQPADQQEGGEDGQPA